MKKIVITITLLVSALLILRFTPASQQKEILIKNKIEHVNNYVSYPHNWIKWYPALKEAWAQDGNSIHIKENAAGKTFSFVLPGKEIQVTSVSGVEYHIQEAGSDAKELVFSFSPDEKTTYTKVKYTQRSNMLYQVLPFLQSGININPVIASLQYALEDVHSFYGFDISTSPSEGKAYLVKKATTSKQNIFTWLPHMFSAIEEWNKKQGGEQPKTYNISYIPTHKDSVEIMTGIVLSKTIPGNDSIEYMKIPEKQLLLVGNYEGVYAKKEALYTAMALYMMDNNLPQISAFFERFEPGKIPTSDSSIVKMQLCFPYYPR